MTVLEEKSKRGWTEQEAKDFVKEVERLKESWYPGPEVSTGEALANLRKDYPTAYLRIEKENRKRHEENDRLKQERLRKIKEENSNLEWPKPEPTIMKKSSDYWKDGCLYCDYKPRTTHDYEVHIVTRHPGKPAYPGPADLEKNAFKLLSRALVKAREDVIIPDECIVDETRTRLTIIKVVYLSL